MLRCLQTGTKNVTSLLSCEQQLPTVLKISCEVFLPLQRSWGKVIFLVACVKNSVHRGVPGQVHPRSGTSPIRYTLQQVHTPHGQVPPKAGTPPGQVHTPGRYTPHGQVHTHPRQVRPLPGTPPCQILRDTVNERAVCILLECILVLISMPCIRNQSELGFNILLYV